MDEFLYMYYKNAYINSLSYIPGRPDSLIKLRQRPDVEKGVIGRQTIAKAKVNERQKHPGVCLNYCDPGLRSSMSSSRSFLYHLSLSFFHGNGAENNWLSLAVTIHI